MNDSKQLETLAALAEDKERKRPLFPIIASVRVSAGPYLALASVFTFVSALLLRAEHDFSALALVVTAWIALPLVALTDRIVFDGRGIRRNGPFAFLVKTIAGSDHYLFVEDFEIVETNAVRTLRRGGSVRYRYRTQIDGKGRQFVISSGGKAYRKLIRELLPLVHDDKLDNRSRDLRDYLNDPRLVTRKARLSTLASADLLEQAKSDFRLGGKEFQRQLHSDVAPSNDDLERAHLLRRLGNELRVAGRLREAGEAFRRALIVTPTAAWLIYDLGRLLRSQAGVQANARLLNRARAALRLASIRARNDLNLLPLIGESFLECGDQRQARKVLQRVVDIDSANFKARMSLADIALRDGKLAHVIHHYHEAGRANPDEALARYARREADYYMTLNNYDDYLVAELRRISWLQNTGRVRRLASRVTNSAVLLALLGSFVDPLASSVGWSLATSSLVIWLVTVVLTRALYKRAKPREAS